MTEISVILATFHSDYKRIVETVDSILKQKNISFEIIISEDSEDNGYYDDLKKYFDSVSFYDYFFVTNHVNQGTVKNILQATEYTHGKYVKLISPGDMLISDFALFKMYRYLEENGALLAFVDMQCYKVFNNEIVYLSKRIPFSYSPYRNGKKERIARTYIIYNDWISGASEIYERNCLIKYLDIISNKVVLCEDAIALLMFLDDQKWVHIGEKLVLYEYGVGVSTVPSDNNHAKLANDTINLCKIISERYPEYKRIVHRRERDSILCANNQKSICRTIKRFLLMPDYALFKIYKTISEYFI
ncbi:glycosyltransferase [Butyrivibrio fibrisolvens]|uniref:glycosyltransferase n=1 Tax=Butyrivibrio fibrisolvens TaxID=831 RepID=UPI0004051D48|nr:glycosyltransferase [Butyrivibrio fibrisolvens]